MSTRVAIGVDLGGTTVKAGIVSAEGKLLYQNRLASKADSAHDDVIQQIESSILEAMGHAGNAEVGGIGLGSPGVVDDAGVVKAPPNFKDFDNVPLQKILSEKFKLPVKIENDANAAAIAESRFGSGKKYPNFLFVIWGTGVGGGIILDRKIFRGPSGGAGEIGHVCIDVNGPRCNCGATGCVEAFIGQRYLSQRTAEKLKNHSSSKILELAGGNPERIEPVYISRAAQAGDALAREILIEAGMLLGVALGAVMNIMDLRVSIIGGGVSAAGEVVMDAIKKSVQEHVLKPLRPDIQVLPAKLGNDAGILGAAGLVL